MEFVLPYDPYELYVIYNTKPGMSWFNRQRVFTDLREIVEEGMGGRNCYLQDGIDLQLTFFLNPKAKWLGRRQSHKVRTIPFSSLILLAEHICHKTIYESDYYVRDLVVLKRYDSTPRIEMRYALHGSKEFRQKAQESK